MLILIHGQQHQVRGRGSKKGVGYGPPLFWVANTKKGGKSKKEWVSKQKLLKDCHQGQNIVLVILKHLEFENFSCLPTMVADNTFHCSMAPPLWNPFHQPYNWWLIFTDIVFSFEKVSNGQNYSSSDSYHPIKNSPWSKISLHPTSSRYLEHHAKWLQHYGDTIIYIHSFFIQ